MTDPNQNNQTNKGDSAMENKIQQILSDIDAYKEAIEEAQNALAAAEQELDEELESAFSEEDQ